MAFKKFTYLRAQGRNYLSLRKNKALFIPSKIFDDFNPFSFLGAIIFVDKDDSRVGLEFSKYNGKEDSMLKVTKEKNGYTLSMVTILNFFEISKINRRFILDASKEDKMLVFSLKNILQENK